MRAVRIVAPRAARPHAGRARTRVPQGRTVGRRDMKTIDGYDIVVVGGGAGFRAGGGLARLGRSV